MKILKLLIVTLLLAAIFVSCTNKSNTEKPNGDDNDKMTTNISDYTIVRTDSASQTLTSITSHLKKAIAEALKAELTVKTDYSKDENTDTADLKEFLIGNTNRNFSQSALKELSKEGYEHGFIIKASDTKIAIVGLSHDDTLLGVKYFINNYVLTSENEKRVNIKSGDSVTCETGKILYMSENFNTLTLERLSTIYDPGLKGKKQCTYNKIIKLEHSGENNGTLLATHETVGWGDPRYPVYKSTDDGKTWEEISKVDDTYNKGAQVGYQPFLLELPEDIGDFKKGTIFMASCTRVDPNQTTILVMHYSTDIGKSWKTIGNIVVGGEYNKGTDGNRLASDGVWEPCLVYDSGKIYCFYSDERDNEHSQRIVFKSTSDGVNWSAEKEAAASAELHHRPGMATVTKMGNGQYALAFEMISPIRQIYIKFTDTIDDWGDPADLGKAIKTSDGHGMASGPQIAWTKNGGECGTLVATAQYASGGSTDTKCNLFISFDYGKTFISIPNPIPNRVNDNVRSGYSPGFFVDSAGDVYYVNNPEVKSGAMSEKFMFAKLKFN